MYLHVLVHVLKARVDELIQYYSTQKFAMLHNCITITYDNACMHTEKESALLVLRLLPPGPWQRFSGNKCTAGTPCTKFSTAVQLYPSGLNLYLNLILKAGAAVTAVRAYRYGRAYVQYHSYRYGRTSVPVVYICTYR